MNRRRFLRYACGCSAGLAGVWPGVSLAQNGVSEGVNWAAPQRFVRPAISTEEGGLWAMMDREEARLRRSPFAIRDRNLHDYVQSIACRLGGEHCPDIRIHLVHTPLFNASMAPNGMMQVWSGLLLRAENEAQLAAVLGHEIGHYMERHTLEQLRDAKSRSAFAQVLGILGGVGALGQIALLAGMYGHSRDQERSADRISVRLMSVAGYDPIEASRIWDNLLLEITARADADPGKTSPMFASHPPAAERREALARLASLAPGGATGVKAFEAAVAPFRFDWLQDEIKRGQYEESLALFGRMLAGEEQRSDVLYARGEVRRLRAREGDLDAALADLNTAVSVGGEPAEAHRSLGLLHRSRESGAEARASFQRYLQRSPDAPDADLIKSYMEELPS